MNHLPRNNNTLSQHVLICVCQNRSNTCSVAPRGKQVKFFKRFFNLEPLKNIRLLHVWHTDMECDNTKEGGHDIIGSLEILFVKSPPPL
jgi:hypothetical protein